MTCCGCTKIRVIAGLVLLFMSPLLGGCATHADFVDLRQEIRSTSKTQLQAQSDFRQQINELEHRIEALEVVRAVEVSPAGPSPDVEALKVEVVELRDRLSRIERTQTREGTDPEPEFPVTKLEEPALPEASESEPDLDSVPSTPSIAPPPSSIPRVSGISPTTAFNLAYNDYLNGKYDLAIMGFQRFIGDFSNTTLAPNAYYWLGESYYQKRDYFRAIRAFEHVVHQFPDHAKVPASLYKIGISAQETGDNSRARSNLTRVIEEYSTSNEASLAKNRLAEIR